MELHVRPEPVDAGGHGGGKAEEAGHRVHPADQQRKPLPGHGVGAHEVRGRRKAENRGCLADALCRQVVPSARRQVGCAVAHAAGNAAGQQEGQSAVDGRVRFSEDVRQFRRIDKRHPAESVDELSVGEFHTLSVSAHMCGSHRELPWRQLIGPWPTDLRIGSIPAGVHPIAVRVPMTLIWVSPTRPQ